MRILVLDDDTSRAARLATLAERACPDARVACAAGDPLAAVDEVSADFLVIGPGHAERGDAVALVRALRGRRPEAVLLVLGSRDAAEAAAALMRAGASDYAVLREGNAADAVGAILGRLATTDQLPPVRRPAAPVGRPEVLRGLVGRSAPVEQVRALVRTAAHTEAHVLIEGETGTGKEVVARAIHGLGRRAGGPFVPVNCAAVPETLAESEFFGHARGAFTGAVQERPGALQLADRGTLFLDEIEDLPLALQAKLLRVVQDREVRPLGATAARRVDVRLVAAANRELWKMVEAGTFRSDLYYRLRVFTIQLPPLRQRRDDIPLLIEHFVARFNRAHGTSFAVPTAGALRPLLEHPWPGNVRELENVLESLLILAHASGTDLGAMLQKSHAPAAGLLLDERSRILRVLDENRWNRQRAAHALGISRVTLWRRMERHGIRDPLGAPSRETA